MTVDCIYKVVLQMKGATSQIALISSWVFLWLFKDIILYILLPFSEFATIKNQINQSRRTKILTIKLFTSFFSTVGFIDFR